MQANKFSKRRKAGTIPNFSPIFGPEYRSHIRMYRALIFIFSCFISAQTYAQNNPGLIAKIKQKYLSSQSDSSRSGSLMILPAFAYAQETGAEFGIASTYNFYMDKKDMQSRTSNVTFMATLTSNKQKNIKLNTDIWTHHNMYHILSELRYRDWPFNFYGLGNSTLQADEDYLGQKLSRIKLDVERKISHKTYAGLNILYEHFKISDIEAGGILETDDIRGKTGGQYLAFGGSFLIDGRDFTTYSTKGFFLRAKYAYAPPFWKGDHFSGSLAELDSRFFYSPLSNLTIATQALYRGTLGKQAPFYVYRDLGGDSSMRGYYLGRYKDKNYTTAQAELRYRIIPRFGIVAFGGLGSTFSEQYSFRTVPTYGGGLRYFFSLEHLSTVRLDYAVGEKRPGEKQQSGFYLSLSEAF